MMFKRIALTSTVDGLRFVEPLTMTRVPNIDNMVLHCLWPNCRCEKVKTSLEFIQFGWFDDQHLLIVHCDTCGRASGFVYNVSDNPDVKDGIRVIIESEDTADAK